jgi:acetyltransferase-like isoleucine patch superfamily enzyme
MPLIIKLGRACRFLFSGKLPSVLYERIFAFFLPELTGAICLLFYRFLFSNFILGRNIKCWGRILITKSPESRIVIGNQVRIGSDFLRAGIALFSKCKIRAFGPSQIIIGNHVALSGTSISCRTTRIEIGDGTIIAPNCIIMDSDFHAPWPPENRTYNMGYERDREVIIERNVWIGLNCLILKGVRIGENSIVSAGSVVSEDVPPNVIVAGNPAKMIKALPGSLANAR